MKSIIKNILYFIISLIERYEYRNTSLDEDDISKKILNSINTDIMVKTDTGYEKSSVIHITQPYRVWKVYLENGYFLECADKHILFDGYFNEVFCKDLVVGDYLQTDIGVSKVVKIEKGRYSLSMFDMSIDHVNHRYYTNGILSHNTINAAISILHFVLFKGDKNVMIVANIAATTIEIVDKIKNIYLNLPFFLKQGVKNWNQRNIVFENGSKIKTAAKSKTPAIGNAIDFLYMDEFAHIDANIIEKYYTAVIPTVSSISNSKIIITSTPNGMNKFYKLVTDGERPEGDPLKNNYKVMRVYWYQVPGRFVTYYRLNDFKLNELGIDKKDVFEQVKQTFNTNVTYDSNFDTGKDYITVYNNDECTEEMTKRFTYKHGEKDISIHNIATVSTWKEDAIKDIDGEDAFNQEYELRFVNASKSLLKESTLQYLIDNKKPYKHEVLDELERRITFEYSDLKWVDDDNIFVPIERKRIKVIMSVDIGEGLRGDYSVINIFKIRPKDNEIIDRQKKTYTKMSDFFCLEQIAVYRSNLISIEQLAELFYVLAFEYFAPENVKVVLESNKYGGEFLSKAKYVFNQENEFGTYVFFRYQHNMDSKDKKIGLLLGNNKPIVVKKYQDNMELKNVIVNDEETIREITTFVRQTTSHGNVTYAGESSKDDIAMTVVNVSTVFERMDYQQIVAEYAETIDRYKLTKFKEILNQVEYKESVNHSSLFEVLRDNQYKKMVDNSNNNHYARKIFNI